MVKVLNLFLKVVAERIVKVSLLLVIRRKFRNVASEPLGKITEGFSCQSFSVMTFENKMIIAFLSIFDDKPVSHNVEKIYSVGVLVEHTEQLTHIFKFGSFFL